MAASALNCKAGKTPFIYLGQPVGGNPHRHSFWKPVIEKFRSKLASWKGKLLSIDGRITLLTSVLSTLPLFYFSIFKVPKGILKELIRTQKNFLWGTSDESKKIAWVNWERVCLAKNKGGLGIPNLAIKNIALLRNWWDKFYDDAENEKLWKKITISKYYSGTSTVSISTLHLQKYLQFGRIFYLLAGIVKEIPSASLKVSLVSLVMDTEPDFGKMLRWKLLH
ncbi:hypothetical protein SLEP1_g40549 [Rubroshorea leprosula]|uniref:Uncharacterized protein n=1 Tax=Rubroshorea leprosula TaxID=152421 RepID=A0AAV5L419_9ROSI|nr:hypothetical protein SLEP1_g40549 [Rubroshorea leprosula]